MDTSPVLGCPQGAQRPVAGPTETLGHQLSKTHLQARHKMHCDAQPAMVQVIRCSSAEAMSRQATAAQSCSACSHMGRQLPTKLYTKIMRCMTEVWQWQVENPGGLSHPLGRRYEQLSSSVSSHAVVSSRLTRLATVQPGWASAQAGRKPGQSRSPGR